MEKKNLIMKFYQYPLYASFQMANLNQYPLYAGLILLKYEIQLTQQKWKKISNY